MEGGGDGYKPSVHLLKMEKLGVYLSDIF